MPGSLTKKGLSVVSAAALTLGLAVTAAPARADEALECTQGSIIFAGPPRDANGSEHCWLGYGSHGPAVVSLQQAIDACNWGNLEVDGWFGGLTRSAILSVQWANHLDADGYYGPITHHKMGFRQIASMVPYQEVCMYEQPIIVP